MSPELRRRLTITLALVAWSRALGMIPVPGLDLAGVQRLMEVSPHGEDLSRRISVAALGIRPYIAGSVVASLLVFLRGAARTDRGLEFVRRLTLPLTVLFSLLGGFGIGIFLETVGQSAALTVLQEPGWPFVAVAGLSVASGACVFAMLANAITRWGIGNGGVLLMGLTLIEELAYAPIHWKEWSLAPPDPRLLIGLLVLVAVIASSVLLNLATWSPGGDEASGLGVGRARLRVNGTGTAGMYVALSLLAIPPALLAFLVDPESSWLRVLSGTLGPGGAFHSTAFLVLSFGAGMWLTAWAYDPAGLRDSARRTSLPNDDPPAAGLDDLDRSIERLALPVVLGLPAAVLLVDAILAKAGLPSPLALTLLVVVAMTLDVASQMRVHTAMASRWNGTTASATCGRCKAKLEGEAPHCAACGACYDESMMCSRHAETPAGSLCVVCQEAMCVQCETLVGLRSVCQRHRETDFREGWAIVARLATGLEAQRVRHSLEEAGIRAEMIRRAPAALCGTLGLFDLRPIVPLCVHSGWAGGGFEVFVPADSLERAVLQLGARAESAGAGQPD